MPVAFDVVERRQPPEVESEYQLSALMRPRIDGDKLHIYTGSIKIGKRAYYLFVDARWLTDHLVTVMAYWQAGMQRARYFFHQRDDGTWEEIDQEAAVSAFIQADDTMSDLEALFRD